MQRSHTRRDFLRTTATAGAIAGLGDLSFLSDLRPVSADEARLDPKQVRLDPSIEPVVRMIEETPRNRLLEEVAARLKGGLSYRDLLAGLLLAGVKNVEPRPSVGFKFHAVLVVNSAHLASLASPAEHRWLPIFWALDHFKGSQQRDVEERGDWTMRPVDEAAVPAAHNVKSAFTAAMDKWDEQAADAAVAGLARTAGMHETYEAFFRYGARDFRSIGHKAIYVANSYRTLQCIGWQYAEPVLRSLAYALLMYGDDEENPGLANHTADQPYRRNQELAAKIRPEWRDGPLDTAATEELLQTLRSGSNNDACDLVVEQLNRGIGPQSIWDALQVGAGELLMRQPGIVGLHAMTTTNALHYAYQASGDDETRRLMMLQNAAFLPMFHDAMRGRGNVANIAVGDVQAASPADDAAKSIETICAELSGNRPAAAGHVLGYLQNNGNPIDLIDAARVLVFLKGDDAHDYKFSSAVLEDYFNVSPAWRNQYLALSVFNLPGTGQRDNGLVERTRAALQG
jgi:hypothetical protein